MSAKKEFFIRKLRWLDEVSITAGKDHFTAHVAMIIGKHLNSETGQTFVGRETIADLIGGHVRTVELAIQKLEKWKLLHVDRARGRGHVNTYTMTFPEKAVSTPPLENEKAVPTPPFVAEEKAVSKEVKGGESPLKRRSPDRPNLKDSNLEEITLGITGVSDGAVATPPARLRPVPVAQPKSFRNRGEFEQRIAELITEAGGDGWDVLMELDEVRVAALCRRLKNGVLTQIEIAELCAPHRQQRGLA
ncbi:hypothetical protein [Bradyrhizobium sp. LVM 105]|uniref:hypothetical protein n=1 Tax=Bradyrhizobium sp. LVM 105 TaxID=2341115 RepID=UPI000F808789|nr:hypothetical protein [Bradyrhizobium sp. LVM 105]RTE92443.1 hypothetical protein D6B98_13010 [Bradyrhizobium sp. LVM 105]